MRIGTEVFRIQKTPCSFLSGVFGGRGNIWRKSSHGLERTDRTSEADREGIIISNISSFSYEASRVYNAIMVKA